MTRNNLSRNEIAGKFNFPPTAFRSWHVNERGNLPALRLDRVELFLRIDDALLLVKFVNLL